MPELSPIQIEHTMKELVIIFILVFIFFYFFLLSSKFFDDHSNHMRRRIDRISSPNNSLTAINENKRIESVRRNISNSKVPGIDRLIKNIMPNIGILRQRLERCGWNIKIGDYILICASLWITIGFAIYLIFNLSSIISILGGFIASFGIPHIIVSRQIAKRAKKFSSLLPDALDLIIRGVRSGLPISETMKTIAEEIEEPVSSEFRNINDQVKIGVSMEEAMWEVARKLRISEFNFLVISISIQKETGGNLAEILENLSKMVRKREQMKLKIKAMSSEARASAVIIGSLPFIMCLLITFINPLYMSKLFIDPRGWIMISIGLLSLLIGILIMMKMVRFEI